MAFRIPAPPEEDLAGYCYSRELQGIEYFESCMRAAEENSDRGTLVIFLIVAGVLAAMYFYNKGKADSEKTLP